MEMQKALEGKIYGYDKKTLVIIAALVVVAGVAFYGGAKYEKSKLSRLGLLKDSSVSTSTKKTKKPPVTDSITQTGGATNTTDTAGVTGTSVVKQAPISTTKAQ